MAHIQHLLFLFACHSCCSKAFPSQPSASTCSTLRNRVDCSSGFTGITADLCRTRGCCWDAGANSFAAESKCFYALEGVPVEVVHMINSNHFDAGYADLTANVVNEYFDTYFPRAAAVGKELRKLPKSTPGAGPLRWMTFSYLISLYFDCPAGMGLHCPSDDMKRTVRSAIEAGDIVWSAFPHNAELATGDASMLRFGVKMSQDLAVQLGAEMPTVLSTRDVTGMPKAALRILADAGVKGLSEGMNGRIVPVNVPPAFQWSSENITMPTLWHWGGYGDLSSPGGMIRIPGSKHGLAYCWRDDNTGPPESAKEVIDNAHKLLQTFNASNPQVVSSSLHQFLEAVSEETPEVLSKLPVITQDLADSWIWGVGSDPIKVQRMRAIHRARTACERQGKYCGPDDKAYFNFSRLAIKNLEHTWGVSVAHYGNLSDAHWDNKAFHQDLANKEEHLMFMVRSWIEQRDYGINFPLQALPMNHPVRTELQREFSALSVKSPPDTATFQRLSSWSDMSFGHRKVSLAMDGSIVSLIDTERGTSWASNANPLALLRYETLDLEDFKKWQADYLIAGTGGENEYGKPESFMKAQPTPEHQLESGVIESVWKRGDEELLVQLAFNESLSRYYGAPREAWIHYSFPQSLELSITLDLLTKTATRLPEAMFFTFSPRLSHTAREEHGTWSHAKLGHWEDPLDVAYGASRGLHFTSEDGVRLSSESGMSMQVMSSDTGLLRWGAPLPFPTPIHGQPDLAKGASYCLFNNIWNTNYPDWLPFDDSASNMRFRFRALFSSRESDDIYV
eukprot:TRINITY_DN8901_c0_g1_i1.p1 TRINITY_DN8901_c0_g1~~TRINITY_DN8901_c0_g1_i1.p1  ORF type:complete len:791 (-),score=111.14 TRINITY_DN8901_c0_g1_i1:171-2543(-)